MATGRRGCGGDPHTPRGALNSLYLGSRGLVPMGRSVDCAPVGRPFRPATLPCYLPGIGPRAFRGREAGVDNEGGRKEVSVDVDGPEEPLRGEAGTPRRLDPRVRTYWWVRGGIRLVILGGAAVMVDFGLFLPRFLPDGFPVGVLAGGVILVLAALGAALPPIAYERWRFALRERDLWIRQGILVRSVSVIPYRRLQFVDTEQGPLARLFGLSELVVHTAAPGTSGRVPGLDAEEAERLRERLAHLEPDHDDPT